MRPRRDGAGRRIAIGAVVAVIVAGLGAAVAMRPKPLADSWTKIERHMKSGVWGTIRHRTTALWTTVRRQSSDAWVAVRRQGSDAWVAVRRRLPFDTPDGKGSEIAPAAPSRAGTAEATVARGTQRRKTASTKRRRDD